MSRFISLGAIPVYLVFCITLGGSAQGKFQNLVLQLMAIGLLLWAFLRSHAPALEHRANWLAWLIAMIGVLILVQLIPLPPTLWTELPGRSLVAEGYRLLGMELPWLPISLGSYHTATTALAFLPALAVLVASDNDQEQSALWWTVAVLAAAGVSIALSIQQVISGGHDWHLYKFSVPGAATGFFANSNHLGAFLLVSVPFLVALVVDQQDRKELARSKAMTILAVGGAALCIGLAFNRSLAIMLLGLPVLLASAALFARLRGIRLIGLITAAGLAFVTGILWIVSSRGIPEGDFVSYKRRTEFWAKTVEAIRDYWPMGSGIGTFRDIYPLYDDYSTTSRTYVNHAHNDFLEVVLETGLIGSVLIIAFLFWWGRYVVRIWNSPDANSYQRAATIASATLLCHSFVDYPLRTAALSATFAMSLVLMSGTGSRSFEK